MDKTEIVKVPYYPAPINDDQTLLNYQYEYKKGNAQALARMYAKLVEVAYKNINNRSKNNIAIKQMSADERQQKAHDAATYIIEQFLKRPDFIINDSVTGYLYTRIQWELFGKYHQKKCDQMLIFTGDELPASKSNERKFKYLVKNTITGERLSYDSAAELYQNPAFKGLRKKRLVESIQTGRKWKHYVFDLLEIT